MGFRNRALEYQNYNPKPYPKDRHGDTVWMAHMESGNEVYVRLPPICKPVLALI
jgi:hypothetical protein